MRKPRGASGRTTKLLALAVGGPLLAATAACQDPTVTGAQTATPPPAATATQTATATTGAGSDAGSAPSATSTPVDTTPTSGGRGRGIDPIHPPISLPAIPTELLPTLGTPWAPDQQGYGQVRPANINNGGDPTGIVTGLTWSSWGGTTATGSGTAEYVASGQSVAQGSQARATVVAFSLGICGGKPAYRQVEWYFPQYGQHFDPANANSICGS